MNTRAEQPALLTRRDRMMLTITVVAAAAAGVLHFADVNAVVAFVVVRARAGHAGIPGRPFGRGARRPARAQRHWDLADGAGKPARTLRHHVRAQGGPVRRGEGHHRRLDSLERPAGARPGVRGRRHQARSAAFRRRRRTHARTDVHPRGVHPAVPSLTACAAHPGGVARADGVGGRLRRHASCCSRSRCRPRWESGDTADPAEHPRASSPIVAGPDSAKAAQCGRRHTGSGRW